MPTEKQQSDEVVTEWREGLDRVVEVQRGPGEDVCSHLLLPLVYPLTHRLAQVEVEVQKNFYAGKLRACDLRHHPCTALEQRLRGGRGARGGEDRRTC